MDYREEIAGIGDVEGESIAVGSRREYESKMADSLLDKQSSRIDGELEEKGSLPLNESGGLGISLLKHEEVEVFEKPGFINADRINGSFPEQELPSKVREQSDDNQTVDEIDRTGENERGTFPEPSEATSCLEEERNTESIESCPPIPELHHHLSNETGEPLIEDGQIMENPVPEVLPGKEIETEDVNENAPVGVVEPNIEHETVVREKDDSTDAEEPEIITYRGRDLVEEGYHGNPPRVELENENVLQTEELKGKGHSVFIEESGGVEGDGLEKAIPSDGHFIENYNIAEKKGEEIGIFSSNEDARKPVTEGGDEVDGQIKGTVEPQVSEASVPEEKVDVEVPNEEVAPDIPNVKDNSVDGLPTAEVSALRNKILDEDEIPKASDNDADEIYFGDHKEEDVQGDDVNGKHGLSKDRELSTIETVTVETGLPVPGAPSNWDSASHPENDFAGGKNEGSEADSIGITTEITDQVAIERDNASPDSNVYTEAMDGYPGNDPISVPEVTRDEFQLDVTEKEAPSGANASNEFDIAGEEDTSSGLTLSGDHTKKEYEEVSSRASSSEVVQEKAVEVPTEQADTVPGRDNDAEAHSVKDDDTSTRKENETLESTDRDAQTDNASDPIETEVPIVADSLGDFVQQETRVIPPEQESLTETSARPLENFTEERNVSEEALSTLEDQPLDVPCASSEVKHKSEESNISEEVHLHAGLPELTEAANQVSETQTANVPEALTEEKLDIDQRSAELDTEISSVVPVDSNIDRQSASNEASNYKEASAAEAVVTESKIPDEKISKKSFKQLKQDADEIDKDGKPLVTEGESERELDKVPDREVVLEYTNMSAGNVLNNTFEKSETDMNTEQPHDMADQGDITLIEVPKKQIEEAPVDTTIPSIDLKDSHSDDQLASNEEPKYEESSAAEVVTNRQILEEKILASSFDGESEAQIGQDTDEVEKYEETAPGKGNSAGEHVEVLAREEVPSVLDGTTVNGMQQRDIANQIDFPLTETTVETTDKAAVYDSAINTSTDNQRDVSHFGTPTQDQELQTNQKRDELTNDDATSTLQDDTKIDRQTEDTPDITLRETTDEVASKIQEDDSFGITGEVSENPIDGQSASNEDSNYEEASAAEAVVTKSKIPEETSTEEQLRQDTVEIDHARELDEVPNGEVPEATNASSRNTPNEKFEQIKTEVSGEQPRDMADQGDNALTEVPGEPIEQDGVYTTIPLVDQKDGCGNDQLASNEDPKYEESSVAEADTESEILEEKILTRSFGDSLEAQIGQDADEAEKYEETVVGEGNSAREHDEVPAREEVPSVLDETIVDGVQQQDITDQTDIELTEATVETTEKTVVYDSATDASIDDQIDASLYGTPTQDQALETNQKQDEPTNDDDASTCQDVPKIDTQTEETTDITLRETTDEVVSKIQEDGGFGVASEVLENPIDGQSASNEDSNYEEVSAAEALVFEGKIPEEIAIEEQLRQDTIEINSARELDEVPNREEVLEATNASSGNALNEKFKQLEMEVNGKQPHDLADQGDISLTEVPGEPIEQDGVDTTIPLVDQKDGRGDDRSASIGDPKYEESSAAEAVTEGEILEEKILTRIPDDSLEAQIGQDDDETEKYEETVVGEGNSAREHDEAPAREEVPPDLDETIVDGVQQQDITDQTDITVTEATMETTGKTAVYDSVIDSSTGNQRDLSHFGTPTLDQALKTNQNRDEPTNDDDASVSQDVPKIDTQTEETTDITLRETTDEVVSKIQEDGSFGLASEVLENPIDGQSASNEDSNYEEASAAEVMVFESKIPEEIAIEEQLRPDTVEIDDALELDEVPNREEVLEATNTSVGNPPNEKFKQLETEVSGEQPHDMAVEGDIALTEVPGEPIERDGVDTTIPLVDQKDGRGDDQLASNEDPKYEESSAAEAATESEILEEKILTRSFGDSLEAQIGRDADEEEKYGETAVGEENSAREHDEVPAREEVPSVLDETVVDGVQERNITDQTDIALTEATVETTEKAVVYDSATDASIDDQIDTSHFGTLKQDQELKTNKKQDETTDDNAASTRRDYAEIDTPTEETPDITLSETTDEVVSKIQEDDSFGLASEVLENPIEESAISPDETIKSEEISGERLDVEEPVLGQGDEGSSLVDDNINKNERGTVGSSEFMDVADSIKEIKEDSLQTENVNQPLTGTGITEDKDPNGIVEKDLIYGTESDEKIDAGEVASETQDIRSREVEQYEQHVGESTSLLQVGFSETPESEPSLDQTVVVDQTEEERKEIYDSNDRDGEIADPGIHQSSVNEASDEQTEEEKAAVEVDSNIVSGTETGISDTEPSQIGRDADTKSFEERNSATENTENKESFYEEGKYNIELKDRLKEITRFEELVEAKETSDEAIFSHSAVAEEGILDQGIGMENSYKRDSSLVPPEENEVKNQEVPLGAATDSFSEKKEQDKEAKEPYEEISHPEQNDLVDITEADYDKGTASFIPADTQELITFEGDIQKDEACIKHKMEASENEGEDDQQDAQGILAEEVALEGEIASKDVETDRIIQEDEKANKEAENSREANEDGINKDGEVDMGSSTIDEVSFTQESLANTAPATETADLYNKDSYTTADNSHVEVIEGEKRDLTLSNEIVEEGDSYTVGADTPFSERSISDNQPGMNSENLDSENAGELNSTAELVEDIAAKEEVPVNSEGHVVEATGQRELVIATEISDEAALSDTQNEKAMTLQTQPRDHSYEQVSVESAPAEGSMIEFNGENGHDGQDKTSDEQSSRVEIDNPVAEVEGIESNEVLQHEAKTTEGGSAEEAPQLAHYTEISSDGPSDEMSTFSTSVPDDVQEREIREIVASEDDQTSRTIQVVSEHTNVEGVASADAEAGIVKTTQPTQRTGILEKESIGVTSATITPDENDDSKEECFVIENQITSEQILESTDQQIKPIPSEEVVQEESEVVESASIGKSTLDENPLLHVSEKVSESESIQSRATNETWSNGKEPMLQTDISQDESDTSIPKYADKERDVTETEEISTEEDASKIKEVVSEDAGQSIGDAIREVIPVTTDTQPRMSSEYLDGENAGELNPTSVSVEDGAIEEEGTDAGIEEASETIVDSKGYEEETTGQSELINAKEVSAEAALSDVPDETAATIQTVPADDLYERDFVELTEESKVHVESATADGSTIECYANTEQDIEDKTFNEQTSQVEIDNRDLATDILPRDVLATAENVKIDRAAFDERTTRSSDICEQKSALVEEVERDRSLELSTLEEAFIQTDREDISLPPEVEVKGSESNEVLQKEAETKERGLVEEAPQFAHSMEISSDGPSHQIPALSTSVPDNVQEIRTPEIVTSKDDQTNRTIRKELDNDSGNKVEQEENVENEEKEIGVVHTQEYTSNEERPANGVLVEETIASDQLTQEQESSNSRSGENIGEVIKDVHTDIGGVAAVGIVKPTEPTEITGKLENESVGETGENVMPDETDDSKEESFDGPIPHEEAVIAETEDVEPVSVGESTLDQSPLADVSREVSTLLHARTEAWSDGNEPTLQTDVCQDESDTSMSKFADKEIDIHESEKITPLELGNRDFTSTVQTKVVLTEEDTSKIKEVVSKGAGGSVDEAIGEVIPVTSDTQPSMSSEYLDSENGGELNSASVSVEDVAGKEEGTDAGIEEISEALIDSKGHEVEATGQRYLINTMEVSDEAALSDASNETAATIQIVPTMAGSTIEFDEENEQEVQDKMFNEKSSQVEIDNQDLAAYATRDVPATVENVEIDRAELDEHTDGIDRSLPPEAETGGNERNQVLQNESEIKEKFSGEEAPQSTKISSDGPSDPMSTFSTSIPDAVQERERREIVASEDEQMNRTVQEELDDESRNKVEQGDNAEKAEQEFTSNEERHASGESFEATISSEQLTQSTEQESNGSLGGENVSEVIKYVYTDIDGVSSGDAEVDITQTTQPIHSTGNLEEESIGETSTAVIPDENLMVPCEEAVLAETEDVEQASVGESTLEKNPLADESTLLHARTEVRPDGNEPTLQTDVRQDESDTSMPKYAEKERNVPANGKIAPPELGDRDFSSAVPTKDILTEEDASKTDEVESVDVAADDTKEQPSVTTEDTILKNKEVQDDTGHAAGKPEDMIEIYGDKTSVAASVVDAETTIPRGNEETAEVGESVDDAIEEVIPMTSDSSSPMPKEEEMLATETEHEKENASLEIRQRNLKDTADLKYVNINEMAVDIPSTDGQAPTSSVSYLPQGSIDAITAASVDQESASLTLPSEETVVDKAWTSREYPDAEHFEVGFKETGTEEDTAEKYGESRSLDFTSAQADQETKNEINGGEILSDGDAADKADYGLASEAVEIADKVDPSPKEKEEKAFDEAQIFQEMASQEQDEYKQGAADEDKAPILSDANDPVEGTVDRVPLEEAEGQNLDSVEGMCTDRKMETPVPNVQGSSEEIFEGDRTPAIEDSEELNQVIASKEDAPTAYHDSGLPRDASLAKEVMANLPGCTERGLPPAEAREFRDQSEVNLDSKEFEGEKFSDDTTTVPQTPVADNLQLPEQSAIIKPDENEEHEGDDHEHIEHSKAAPLMEESSKDVVDSKARQKKSHNHLLSGMSSKVKSSISKVKKVITGKSSNHNKEHSPKHGH